MVSKNIFLKMHIIDAYISDYIEELCRLNHCEIRNKCSMTIYWL